MSSSKEDSDYSYEEVKCKCPECGHEFTEEVKITMESRVDIDLEQK